MHILSMTHMHERFKLLTAIEEEKINEEPQVWLQHFISCLFHAVGHFIKHLVCIRGTKSKPTPPCEACEEKWHQMAK